MEFEDLPSIAREELSNALLSCKSEVVSRALLRMALHEIDWQWAEQRCLSALKDERPQVRRAAAQGLGHIARIHGKLTLPMAVEALTNLLTDPDIGGVAEDALDDILVFMRPPGEQS